MENFNREIESTLHLLDNRPIEEFDGLSRADMRYLIYNPFSKNSPLQISKEISNRVLDQISFLKPFELFLNKCVEVKYIRLTKKGFLPTALVREIDISAVRSQDFVSIERSYMRYSEKDSHTARTVRVTTENAGFLINRNNKLMISQKLKECLQANDRAKIFRGIFKAYTQLYDWKSVIYMDNLNTGQEGFAYTLYLLSKYGKSYRPISFYIDKYFKAFTLKSDLLEPDENDLTTTDLIASKIIKLTHSDSPNFSFEIGTFEKFLVRFNLVNYQFVQKQNSERQLMIKKSRIFDKIMTFS